MFSSCNYIYALSGVVSFHQIVLEIVIAVWKVEIVPL